MRVKWLGFQRGGIISDKMIIIVAFPEYYQLFLDIMDTTYGFELFMEQVFESYSTFHKEEPCWGTDNLWEGGHQY